MSVRARAVMEEPDRNVVLAIGAATPQKKFVGEPPVIRREKLSY